MRYHIFNNKIFPSFLRIIPVALFILPSLFASCKEDHSSIGKTEVAYDEIDAVFKEKDLSVVLNHLYVTLDSITFESLKNSEFLKTSYANLDQGMPDFKKLDTSANSFYLT